MSVETDRDGRKKTVEMIFDRVDPPLLVTVVIDRFEETHLPDRHSDMTMTSLKQLYKKGIKSITFEKKFLTTEDKERMATGAIRQKLRGMVEDDFGLQIKKIEFEKVDRSQTHDEYDPENEEDWEEE